MFIQTLSKLTLIAGIAITITSISSPIQTTAQVRTRDTFVSIPSQGLNIRDKDCNVMTTVPKGSMMTKRENYFFVGEEYRNEDFPNITCTVNGTTYSLRAITYINGAGTNADNTFFEGYVAENFVESVTNRGPLGFESAAPYLIGATAGLNVRDENCQKLGALPFNSYVGFGIYSQDINNITCEVNGTRYAMTRMCDLRQENPSDLCGYVATYYLKRGADTQDFDVYAPGPDGGTLLISKDS